MARGRDVRLDRRGMDLGQDVQGVQLLFLVRVERRVRVEGKERRGRRADLLHGAAGITRCTRQSRRAWGTKRLR